LQVLDGPAPKEEPVEEPDWRAAREVGLGRKEHRAIARELKWIS
jgi:hypothetical protein